MRAISILIIVVLISCASNVNKKATQPIRLVLQITIDGLRADLISRYQDRFVEGGFNYLLENGTVYSNAHYQHANTETIVGHTTLATGAYPSVHGMVGNVWYDRSTGEIGYNIEDPDAPMLPTRQIITEGVQVDPAQKASRTKGRSPKAILAPTISDEIFKHTAGNGKIFGISGKDRSAVSMAGHTGKAFWYSTDNGDFVTSKYYYEEYPEWVKAWNAEKKAEKLAGTSWELLNEVSTYKFRHQDDRPYETDLRGYGKTFPHDFGKADDPLLPTRIIVSPKGDALTFDFAKTLVTQEKLGQDEIIDYLSISFSSVDAVNHFFGPSSLENEDVVLQLDRTMRDLINFIDEQIGLKNTLIVLSADHGMAEMPEYMTELGYDVGRIYSEEIVERVNVAGRKLFGIEGITKSFFRPSLYLDQEKISNAGLNPMEVERKIAFELTDSEGIALAVGRGGLQDMERHPIYVQIKNNYHPSRSGDIYVAQKPYWFLFEKGPIAVMHGSPWKYDTHVPIIFVGPGIERAVVDKKVHPVDVAPSIALIIGISPPASSVGTPLPELITKTVH
jgi:predicted AlkP superfamily pyrophosphatase or phosphodiesterase